MNSDFNRDWWDFSLHPDASGKGEATRGAEYAARLEGRDLSYQSYLQLKMLLSAQDPSSSVPDERVFIITHQLIELVFKQMLFDFAVVARTLQNVLQIEKTSELQRRLKERSFWNAALTASSRLQFSAGTLLPTVIQYLASKLDTENYNFSQEQFFRFRDNLGHASGMQSSQFRLIQRAMGKSEMLSLRLFPSKEHTSELPNYKDQCPFNSVVDDSVLAGYRHEASPQLGGVLDEVARADDLSHQVLARYAVLHNDGNAPPVRMIERSEIDKLISTMGKLMAHPNGLSSYMGEARGSVPEEAMQVFAVDLERAVHRENARRLSYQAACIGSIYLRLKEPSSALVRVLHQLALADDMLHSASRGFLFTHLAIVRDLLVMPRKPEAPNAASLLRGTGGGGTSILGFMFKHLLPLFPALVAFRSSEPSM